MAIKFVRRLITVSAAGLGAYILLFQPWQKRWGATDEEIKRTQPGDELIPHPDMNLTRAITIQARPAEIWSWLVQIGQGRGGFYSYDWLENLIGAKMKNAEGINPAWQHISVGDIIPVEPGGKGFKVLGVEPERALVIGSVKANDEGVLEFFKQGLPAFTWAFILAAIDSEHTRLISRFRGQTPQHQPLTARLTAFFFFDPLDFLMTRKMLLGIKRRAEQANTLVAGQISQEKPLKKAAVPS